MTLHIGCRRRRFPHWMHDERGRVTAFVVVMTAAVLAFAGLVLDGGLALAAKVRAVGEAQEAARAGAQAIDLSAYRADGTLRLVPAQAEDLARHYLVAAGETGTVTVNGNTVIVTVTATQRTEILDLIGVNSISVSGQGSAHPERGIIAPEP